MSTAAIVGGSVAAGLGGAALSSHAAGKAASAQAQAADQASQLQYQLGQQNLGFQEQQYANSLGLLQPYYNTGTQSLGTLAQLMGLNPTPGNTSVFQNPSGQPAAPQIPSFNFNGSRFQGTGGLPGGGRGIMMGRANGELGPDANLSLPSDINSFTQSNGLPVGAAPVAMNGQPASATVPTAGAPTAPGNAAGTNLPVGYLNQTFDQQFTPPTGLTEQNDPGYQARLNLGMQALQNSAAAKGGLLGGNTATALNQFGQDYASNEYGNVYNRALSNYNTAFNTFNANRSNLFNRYASLAGLGQTSAQQLSNAGLSTGANVGNLLTGLGSQIGGNLQNAAAARASGYVGGANAFSGALGGLGNLATLYALSRQGAGAGTGVGTSDPTDVIDAIGY